MGFGQYTLFQTIERSFCWIDVKR